MVAVSGGLLIKHALDDPTTDGHHASFVRYGSVSSLLSVVISANRTVKLLPMNGRQLPGASALPSSGKGH
jgi:hypothetical protein